MTDPALVPQSPLINIAPGSEVSHDKFKVILVNPFSNINGDVVAFSILVTTKKEKPTNADTLPSWKEAKSQNPMLSYLAVKRCQNLFDGNDQCWTNNHRRRRVAEPLTEVLFTVGGDSSCSRSSEGYCNGPLNPVTTYYVALIGYNEVGGYSIGEFSEPIQTGDEPIQTGEQHEYLKCFIFVLVHM